MTETRVAIGTVKRDISELVNRVAYGSILLPSNSKSLRIHSDDQARLPP